MNKESKKYIVDEQMLNALIGYLIKNPYEQVAHYIEVLKNLEPLEVRLEKLKQEKGKPDEPGKNTNK